MKTIEKTIKSERIFEGKIINVKVDSVMLPNGKTAFREEVEHLGGACVLANFKGKFPLVSQFRYAYGQDLWEIPAGKIEVGENEEVCAKRELIEEVGLKANEVVKLLDLYPSPAYTNEVIRIFYADNLEAVKQKLDKDEFLNIDFFTIDELLQMIKDGKIKDSKTIVAILFYNNFIKKSV